MAIHEALYAGLLAGQIDVSGATVDDMLPTFDPEQPYECVMALDESRGADGIVATRDIRSIADLKGKLVGFNQRTVSQFFLNVLLKDAGLSEADIETVDLTSEDAGNAFMMREVDAAVTWELWLTQGRQSEQGHLLADSSETPGLIVDCLLVKPEVLDARLPEFRALARAWDAAVHFVEDHPDEANDIMARAMSAAGLRTPRCSPRPWRESGSTIPRETGNTSARRTAPVRSTRPRNTPSISGGASARSSPTSRPPT